MRRALLATALALLVSPVAAQTLQQLNAASQTLPGAATPVQLPTVSATSVSVLVPTAKTSTLFGIDFTQNASTAGFLALVDAAAAPSGGASITPKACIAAAAGTSLRYRQQVGDLFQLGIVMLSTTSCSTYTANTALLIGAQVR